MQATEMSVQDAIASWPPDHKDKAQMLIDKYGLPQEASETHLSWFGNAPWKRTTIYKMSYQHDFPKPHKDYLKQTIDYKVPPNKACDIEQFDGSALIDRTAGELSARCDAEEANFLLINLVDQICNGKTDVDGARMQYGDSMMKVMQKQSAPLTEGFQFTLPKAATTADADMTTLKMGM